MGTNGNEASEGGASRFFQQFHEIFEPDVGFGAFYCAKASRAERTANGRVANSHPTVKPQKLLEYLIRLVSPPGSTVLDPFCGSGSTLLAARSLGLSAIGIEQDEHYCSITRERLAAAESPEPSRKAPSRRDDKPSPPACDTMNIEQLGFPID
jgi:hypothetical protein